MSKKNWWRSYDNSSSSYKSTSYKSSFFDWDKWSSEYKPTPKKQIVKPYLNWFDANKKLAAGIYYDTPYNLIIISHDVYKHVIGNFIKKSPEYLSVDDSENLYKKIIPNHLIEDIYSIYYNKSENIEFSEIKDSNKVKFKILEKINNSLLKIVSNNNSTASFLYTKQICQFLYEEFLSSFNDDELKELSDSMKNSNSDEKEKENNKSEDKKQDENQSNSSDNNSEKSEEKNDDNKNDDSNKNDDENENGNENSIENNNENSNKNENKNEKSDKLNNQQNKDEEQNRDNPNSGKSGSSSNPLSGHNVKEDTSQLKDNLNLKNQSKQDKLAEKIETLFEDKMVQQRLDKAISKADDLMLELEKAGIDTKEDNFNKIELLSKIDVLRKDISLLAMNKQRIAEAIKKILDKSKNYFSKKYTVKEIDFLEADEIEELYGIEYIHPVFKNTMLDRISTEEKRYQGKIDLFIDISGSMSSNCGIPGVSCLLFAKSIALTMLKMDMLNNLYTFDTRITKIPVDELSILMISCGGGTSIDCVVDHVVNTSKNNAICLTDGEDRVSKYDEKIFFMGTVGVLFSYFTYNEEGKRYILNDQCINFDGNKTTQITKKLLEEKKCWRG